MPGTNPHIHAVENAEEAVKPPTVRLTWSHSVTVINSIMLVIVIACGVFLITHVKDLSSTAERQADLITKTKDELVALRHVIGNQTAEDVIFLKIIILRPDIDTNLARSTDTFAALAPAALPSVV